MKRALLVVLGCLLATSPLAESQPKSHKGKSTSTAVPATKPRSLQSWEKDNVQTMVTGLEDDLKTCEGMKKRDDYNIEGEVVLRMAKVGGDQREVERKVR